MDAGIRLLRCSWPRPVGNLGPTWQGEPDWDAPPLPWLPQPHALELEGETYQAYDWCAAFAGAPGTGGPYGAAQLRGFHVVFELEVLHCGQLVFWCDDGCIIYRNGSAVHRDPEAHPLWRAEIPVRAGDRLLIAHWQLDGAWIWAGRVQQATSAENRLSLLWDLRHTLAQRVAQGSGPALKLYTNAKSPLRTVISVYSLIQNGYTPSRVLLFGEHQWKPEDRRLVTSLLPFAEVVPTRNVLEHVEAVGGALLAERAWRRWWVFKAFVMLLYPPTECCALDDDVFILDSLSDALKEFEQHDLVFACDTDYARWYHAAWKHAFTALDLSTTGRFNAGLFLMRNPWEPQRVAQIARTVPPGASPLVWEQGLIASLFSERPAKPLPTQRYFYPVFDGLPGGFLGYDYRTNPCGFASIHFGGLPLKPNDAQSLEIAAGLLAPRQNTAAVSAVTPPTPGVPASQRSAIPTRPDEPVPLPGALQMPRLVRTAGNSAYLFAVDNPRHGRLWARTTDGEWRCLGGELAPLDGIEAFATPQGEVRVYARGADGALWRYSGRPNEGGEWRTLGGSVRRIAAARAADGIHLFARGADRGLWHAIDGEPGSSWMSLARQALRLAALATPDGGLALFIQGDDGWVWHRRRAGAEPAWSSWERLHAQIPSTGRLAARALPDGRLELYLIGLDRAPGRLAQLEPGGPWGKLTSFGGHATELAPSPAATGPAELFARGGNSGLWLCRPGGRPDGSAFWQSLEGQVGQLTIISTGREGIRLAADAPDGSIWQIERDPGGEWGTWENLTPWISGNPAMSFAGRFQHEWSDPEANGTWCGQGSTFTETENIRRALPGILRGFGIRTLNDAGCGDFAWIRHLDLSEIDYLGYDLREWPTQPGLPFCRRDIIHEPLRPCDLVLCRDVLFHLPNSLVLKALENFARSGRYLLTTSMRGAYGVPFNNRTRHRWDQPGDAGYSPLDLEAAPFNLPAPLLTVPERSQDNRFLGLWDLQAWIS